MNNKIAYQGVEGAFSNLACLRKYPDMQPVNYQTFDDVIKAVENDEVKYGLIPIENSYAGRVAEIHNIFPYMNLRIVGEVILQIEHNLVAKKGTALSDIKKVYSHPQALMQCKNNLAAIDGVQIISADNTAIAAKIVSESNQKDDAALASLTAASVYGLDVIKKDMQDIRDNYTTFVVLSKEICDLPFNSKSIITSVIFEIRNIPAALYKALGGFATNAINMIKLESYIPGGVSSKQAQFFLSFQGHPELDEIKLALEELGFFSKKVKLLGIYEADALRKL